MYAFFDQVVVYKIQSYLSLGMSIQAFNLDSVKMRQGIHAFLSCLAIEAISSHNAYI